MPKVKEMMTTEVECCTPLDNMYEAAVKMRDYNVGAIPMNEGYVFLRSLYFLVLQCRQAVYNGSINS